MKLTMAILAAALYVTANSTIVRADPQSVEATEDAAKADHKAEGAKAETKTAQADAGATEHKMETDYMFAKEKCDPLSGKAKPRSSS